MSNKINSRLHYKNMNPWVTEQSTCKQDTRGKSYLSMITGSEGVSFLLPQLFLSQHRLEKGTLNIILKENYREKLKTKFPYGPFVYPAQIFSLHRLHLRHRGHFMVIPSGPKGPPPGKIWLYKKKPYKLNINLRRVIWAHCVCLCCNVRRERRGVWE